MTRVEIDEQARTVTTTFTDGTQLVARPSLDAESVARAYVLGYQGSPEDAVWAMTRDRDPLHTVFAEAVGWKVSIALWAVAHPGELRTVEDRFDIETEKRAVLLMQRLLNVGIAPLIFTTHAPRASTIATRRQRIAQSAVPHWCERNGAASST